MNVLLADDDSLSRAYIESLLTAGGHTFESYEDGQSAWSAIERDDSPQLLLLDWMMPGMDGMEICQRLASRASGNQKYILMLSGINDKNEIAQILATGADDYMTKPIHQYEFLARVQVAERIIGYSNGLKRRNTELENLVRRYTQMGEIESKRQTNDGASREEMIQVLPMEMVTPASPMPCADTPVEEPVALELPVDSEMDVASFVPEALPDAVKGIQAIQKIKDIAVKTFSSFNLETSVCEIYDIKGVRYVGWTAFYLNRLNQWCNLIFEFTEGSLSGLSSMLLDNPSDDVEQNMIDTAAQLINLLQGSVRAQLNKELIASQVTFAPSAVRLKCDTGYKSRCPQMEGYGIIVCGMLLNVWIGVENAPSVNKSVDSLKPFCVLPEALKSTTNPPIIVAKKWTVLNEESIRSLQELAEANKIGRYVLSLAPSALYGDLYRCMWE